MNPITEAFKSIKENKSRSILSSIGVAWGIFILIILLGVGNGFKDGIFKLFSSFAKNSLWVYGGVVAESDFEKVSANKKILFDNNDITILKNKFEAIEYISPELNYIGNPLTSYGKNTINPQIKGVMPDYFNVKTIKTDQGRLINVLDNKESRRIALIGKQVANVLFYKENPIGKSINIAGTFFTVIGVIEEGSMLTQNEQSAIYVPYNTFCDCLGPGREFSSFILSFTKNAKVSILEKKIIFSIAKSKGFNINDKKALNIINFKNQIKDFEQLFTGVTLFLWFIGFCILLSGIVGVSNIMFVIVKERTFEIGIRKAVGAKQKTIIWLILSESIVITTVAGSIGIVLGLLVIKILNKALQSKIADKHSLFADASIDFQIIISCLAILILSGILSGFFPAKKAAKINPVEALRQ